MRASRPNDVGGTSQGARHAISPIDCLPMAEPLPLSARLPKPPAGRLRVLLTGATGYIASQLLPVFRERYDLRMVDVRTTDASGRPVPGATLANLIDDPDADLRPHFEGVDAVVHL